MHTYVYIYIYNYIHIYVYRWCGRKHHIHVCVYICKYVHVRIHAFIYGIHLVSYIVFARTAIVLGRSIYIYIRICICICIHRRTGDIFMRGIFLIETLSSPAQVLYWDDLSKERLDILDETHVYTYKYIYI